MDTFNFSCNLIVINVSIISTKFPHLVLYKEVLVQPSCVCKSQICSNFTFSSLLQHHTSALVRFPPGNKYSHKNTWSQLVKVVLKHVAFFSFPPEPVWTDVMSRNEKKPTCRVYGLQICTIVTAGLISYIKSTQIVTNETCTNLNRTSSVRNVSFCVCTLFFSSVTHRLQLVSSFLMNKYQLASGASK